MSTRNVLFSAVHFLVVCLILGLGIFFLSLPHAHFLRMQLINFLAHPEKPCYLIGGITLGIGCLLFVVAYLINRRGYLQLEMKGSLVDIEKGVIRQCALSYFSHRFPDFEPISEVTVKGKSTIEIITSIPTPQEETFYEEVEEELSFLLSRRLGYRHPFTVTFVES
ncbi:MAG: hypothetical protein KDK76_04805 [Chlamydiia bacterium]|nr:hypothetical protein [Chlamydiia bacterium]